MKKIYLDYAATTPVDPRVVRVMQPYFSDTFGNPSSLHYFGQQALSVVDASREAIAGTLKADFREIVFTGSATEANNLALRGALLGYRVWGLGSRKKKLALNPSGYTLTPRIIISAIEHESVRETAYDLAREGVEVVEIPVDRYGVVDVKKLEVALDERTVLVSIIYANNEIGTIQPIAEISKIIRNFHDESRVPPSSRFRRAGTSPAEGEARHGRQESRMPLLHTDAVQAFQFLDCAPAELGVDLMTISAHKMYGPKGIGTLYAKGSRVSGIGSRAIGKRESKTLNPSGYTLDPILTGGGQEFGLRSGTENVPLIAGFAKAIEITASVRPRESVRIKKLRDYFWAGLKKIVPQAELNVPCVNSSENALAAQFLPHILNVYFPGVSAEHLITKLDILGVAVSSGSACRSRALEASHVIQALGFSKDRALQSIRFSFGRPTTRTFLDAALKKIKTAFA